MKGVNVSGQHSIANVQEDGQSANSSTQPHLEQIKATDYESGNPAPTATNTNAGPVEAGQMGKKQRRAARLSRAERGEVRKPKLVSERMFESASRQLQSKDDVGPVDETLRSALPTKDPPLYDNIKDRMRQMTVELWLVGAKIAYSMQDWHAMEYQSQQAYTLAADLQWEPFKAKCAFPLGVALSRQGHWVKAYESFQEAERTNGYYIPRSEILMWLTLAAESYARSAAPFSSGISAAEGRAPFLTPLDSVVEEKEEYPFPTKEDRKPEGEEPPNAEYSLQAAGPLAKETASPTKPEGHSSFAPLQQVSQAVMTRAYGTLAKAPRSGTSRYGGNTADGSPTDRVPGLPSRPADMPAAVTLATLPAPASIGSPRLYTPKDQAAASPPMAAGTPPLRPALYMLRTGAASSLSEMELPPPFAPKIPHEDPGPEPDQAASPRDDPQENYRKPLDPSSLQARKQPFAHLSPSRQKVGGSDDVVPVQEFPASPRLEQRDLDLISPFSSLPHRLTTDNLRNLSSPKAPTTTTQSSPSPPPAASTTPHPIPAADGRSSTNPPASPPPAVQPTNNNTQDPASSSSSPPPTRLSALRHAHDLEAARIEDEIARVIAIASPLMQSARSASRFSSPRASVLHSPAAPPPPPPRPGWSTSHARPAAFGTGARPRNKRAVSDGNNHAYGARLGNGRPARRGGGYMGGAQHPLSQGSAPLVGRGWVRDGGVASSGSRVRWGDQWVGRKVLGREGVAEEEEEVVVRREDVVRRGEDVAGSEGESGEVTGEGSEAGKRGE
ncbi:MAG: hypothetical protein LQ345_003148 [Seirophora villosa]|nr:MAG: hypothetical protein LQ345_003148 [Seirophora villosa]